MNRITSICILAILPACSIANSNSISIPENETQRLIGNHLSITTESFLKAYMSQDVQQRRLAEMYVLGVIDSTEGELWCGYEIASPDAIQEQVFIGLKKALEKSPQERASTSIKARLKEILPCKEGQ